MSSFDQVIIVDWAAGRIGPKRPAKDQIWIGVAGTSAQEEPVYCRSRQDAEAWLKTRLAHNLTHGLRTLVGFDFPFAYPRGFAKALTGQDDPFAMWQWYAERVEDSDTGENNRFDLAGEINRRFGGTGPFWGNALPRDIEGLPRTQGGYDLAGFAEYRDFETLQPGLQTCWKLAGAGCVGSQVIMGLPTLHRLRAAFGKELSVWPFEAATAPLVLAEIWPSLLNEEVHAASGPKTIRDALQVSLLSQALAALSADQMAQLLHEGDPVEGGILGAAHVPLLKAALKPDLAPPPLSNDCFALPPGVNWQPVDDALALLRDRLRPVAQVDTRPLAKMPGCILAEDVVAKRSNPPFANTAVDGYGFAHACLGGGPHVLPLVQGRAAAGLAFEGTVPTGQAIRILTGATLPEGVDTVVLEEDTTTDGAQIAFNGPIKAGSNTRKAGEDVRTGDVILPKGRRVTPADIALLSAAGIQGAAVHQPLKVGVLSTGDELIEPGQEAAKGQIFDANRPMLLALLRSWGLEAVDLGIARDDRTVIAGSLDLAARTCDAILTSGGASAGDEDHMSALLKDTGSLAAWRIALKPGRPLALGVWNGTPVFGLPGNPVAALVCTLVFARPALNVLGGADWRLPEGVMVPAAFSKNKKPGRREYLRARLREGRVEVFKSEGSGRISGLSWAEGLVELPDEAATVEPGSPVKYVPYSAF
ncbi:MAG: gephyrin-like molybdotransferase Glp [Pseudomonadota bacterium]